MSEDNFDQPVRPHINPMNTEHGRVPVENLVRVAMDSDGKNFLDRSGDPLIANPGGGRVIDRMARILDPMTPDPDRQDDIREIHAMAVDADQRGMFDRRALRNELVRRIRSSDPATITQTLATAARELEQQNMMNPNYAANPAFQHLIEQEVMGLARLAGLQAEANDPQTPPQRRLDILNHDIPQLQERRGGRNGFLNLDINIAQELAQGQQNVNQQPQPANGIDRIVDALRGVDPAQQRDSYADWMLRGEFGQKFTPGQEPKFYQELQSGERRKYDAMLQLSRAVYVKKITSNHPEEFGSDKNIDLQSMSLEQLEILYQMPGMKLLLQNYVRLQVNGEIRLSNGELITLDDCVDEPAVEDIRKRLREDVGNVLGIKEIDQKEADIAAWGMSYCGLIAESTNSRYFQYRNMHREKIGHLPSVMIAGEFVAVMHPQEEYEKRCAAGRIWGNLGLWGKTQMDRIKKSTGFNGDTDIYLFKDASNPNTYWEAKRTGERQRVMDNKQEKQKNVVLVQSPPLLPHTSIKSFFEETKAGGKTLLDYLMDGREIPWDQVQDNPFGTWTAKIDAAYKLFEYYKDTEKVIEVDKPGAVAKWANGFSDLINRLGLNKSLTEKRLHNMKYAAVLCGVKGVRNVDQRYPHPNFIGGKTFNAHAQSLRIALTHRNVKFLSTNMLGIQEKLEPW